MTDLQAATEKLLKDGKVMSLFEHLDELRSRLIRALVGFFVIFCASMVFNKDLLILMRQPLDAVLPGGAANLHFTSPLDVFLVGMKVAGLCSVVISSPWWLFQFWKFVEPAMYPKERRYVLPFVFISVLLFISGVAVCFEVVLPMSLGFLIGLGADVGTPIITLPEYVSLLTVMLFGFGLMFETPLILVLLGMLEVISAAGLRAYRKVTLVIILVLSAIIMPPDIFSMLSMAIPMYLMFEVSILIIQVLERRRNKLQEPKALAKSDESQP